MATLVPVCIDSDADQVNVGLGNNPVPRCEDGWTYIVAPGEFDVVPWLQSEEGAEAFGLAFAASFIVVGMFFVLGRGVRALLNLIERP